MQAAQQLSSFPAAEGAGRPSMEGTNSQKQEGAKAGLKVREDSPFPPSSKPHKVEKRARKAGHSPAGPFLHPLPTIETLMNYPSLTRPVYDSLVRGEPPAPSYKTIIHVPKPPNMRIIDQNLLRAAELSAYRRRKRANSGPRSRSSTGSSTASSTSAYSSNASSVADSDSSASDMSEPPSPASDKATTTSSAPGSARCTPFPSPTPGPVLAQSTSEFNTINPYPDLPSRNSSTESFHSSVSTLSSHCETASELSAPSSSRSSAPSPASSAYPSPPSSPQISRRSSSSGEEFMYPSPPPSPGPSQRPQLQHRERRAFSFPPPPVAPTPQGPALRRRSQSLNSHPWNIPDSSEFDLGEQTLGGGMLYEDEDEEDDMDWSMNGGEVVFGAAGVAISPRAMRGSCCPCEHSHIGGLGLYVIDEEEEEPRSGGA